jgi:hypothetical protein
VSDQSDAPERPQSVPNYLAEGIPKQDLATLRDLRVYVETLIEYREQAVEEAALPDDAEPVDSEQDGKGTVVKEKVQCGDSSCKCASGEKADMHGPYRYRYYWEDGETKSEYLGK